MSDFVPTPVFIPGLAEQLQQELDALDLKRIRPTAEGDVAYLEGLNAQAVAMREQLRYQLKWGKP